MPVADLLLHIVLAPFHHGAPGADADGPQPAQHIPPGADILAQAFPAAAQRLKQLPQNLRVHGRVPAQAALLAAGENVGVFRRAGGGYGQEAVPVLHQGIHEKRRRLPHHGIVGAEEIRVEGVFIMLGNVQAQPGRAHLPHRGGHKAVLRRTVAPDVGIVVRHPAGGPVHGAGHLPPVGEHPPHVVKQRQVHLGQVAAFRGPVVHLRVDVDGVLAAPGGVEALAPQALEVGGQRAGTAGAAQQVAPVEEISVDQAEILLARGKAPQPLVRGQAFQRGILRE